VKAVADLNTLSIVAVISLISFLRLIILRKILLLKILAIYRLSWKYHTAVKFPPN
jgi:hypothetical protein